MMNLGAVSGRVPLVLLLTRLSIFLVMLMWTLDKFFNPDHTSAIFQSFYGVGGVGTTPIYVIGVIQLILVIGFVIGYKKTITYGAVLIMHGLSTLVSFPRYLEPFQNLLFFAGWPMLAGCFAVFFLRDLDTLWVVDRSRKGLERTSFEGDPT